MKFVRRVLLGGGLGVAAWSALLPSADAQDKVDAVFSPYSSPITDAVADVTDWPDELAPGKPRLPALARSQR